MYLSFSYVCIHKCIYRYIYIYDYICIYSIIYIYIYLDINYRVQPGSLKKHSHRLKSFNMHRKHQDPCINVTIASQWPEQELLFFLKAQTKHCLHTTLKLGDQGCLTVLASSLEFKLSWLAVLLKNPVCVFEEPGMCISDVHWSLPCCFWFSFLWKTISHHRSLYIYMSIYAYKYIYTVYYT